MNRDTLIISLGGLVLAGSLSGLVVYPLWGKIYDHAFSLASLRYTLSESRAPAQTISLERTRGHVELAQARIAALKVNPQQPVNLIRFWESVAAETNIVLSVAAAQSPSQEEEKTLAFRIEARRSFPRVAAFVQKIETGQYLTAVESLTVRTLQDHEIRLDKTGLLDSSGVAATIAVRVFTQI